MSRPLWFLAGAGAGVYAAVRARRAAQALTVDGLRDRVGAVVVGARIARDEIAQGRAEAEVRLREQVADRLHDRTAPAALSRAGSGEHAGPATSTADPAGVSPSEDRPSITTPTPTDDEEASS